MNPYTPRNICFLGVWPIGEYRVKAYGISYKDLRPTADFVDAGHAQIAQHLSKNPTRHEHCGVGFAILHEGVGENQICIDRWVNSNELMHEIYVSPPSDPLSFSLPPRDHNSVCVWELYVQAFERQAWIDHVIARPGGPDLDAYFGAVTGGLI